MNNIKERDFSIDILKFLAVFFIINSHMDTLYTNYKMLATGGSIGDTLFLFCSGYTLLLNKNKNAPILLFTETSSAYPHKLTLFFDKQSSNVLKNNIFYNFTAE